MNGSRTNRSIIPLPVWVIAILVYLGIFIGLISIGIPQFPKTTGLPRGGQIALGLFAAAIPALYILLLGYIYRDAERRGMRQWLWVLLAIFIPNAIGIIVYFILRDPLPRICPQCSQMVKAGFAFCPHCGYNLAPACPSCKRAVEPSWKVCPTCGTSLTGVAPAAPVPPPYAGPQNA